MLKKFQKRWMRLRAYVKGIWKRCSLFDGYNFCMKETFYYQNGIESQNLFPQNVSWKQSQKSCTVSAKWCKTFQCFFFWKELLEYQKNPTDWRRFNTIHSVLTGKLASTIFSIESWHSLLSWNVTFHFLFTVSSPKTRHFPPEYT